MSARADRRPYAAAAIAIAALAGGCAFGREYAESRPQWLVLADERTLAQEPIAPDAELPLDYCRKTCVEGWNQSVTGCHLATLGANDAEPSPTAKSPRPPIGTKFLHCHGYTPGGSDWIIR